MCGVPKRNNWITQWCFTAVSNQVSNRVVLRIYVVYFAPAFVWCSVREVIVGKQKSHWYIHPNISQAGRPAFWCTLRYRWLGCSPPSHPPSYRSSQETAIATLESAEELKKMIFKPNCFSKSGVRCLPLSLILIFPLTERPKFAHL